MIIFHALAPMNNYIHSQFSLHQIDRIVTLIFAQFVTVYNSDPPKSVTKNNIVTILNGDKICHCFKQ